MPGSAPLLLPSCRSAPSFPDLRHPWFLPAAPRWSRPDHAVDGMVSEEGSEPTPAALSPPRCFPSFTPPACSVRREENLTLPWRWEQSPGEAEGFILAEAPLVASEGYNLPRSELPPALHLSVWIREPRGSFLPTPPNHSKSLFFE